ncbi:MAG TPA: sulfotransferase [Chitinophagaceae bacterium]|jgi:hypothetical protein
MSKRNPVIIIGMARSGTALVTHVLGSLPNVHIEVEPHALWKSGNFKYLNDEEYDINEKIVNNIRKKLSGNLNGKQLIEKSPINSLRPYLVHAVFPNAKIVYLERDPVRCIYSNYVRSLKKDSFKLSIILKKYFLYTGTEDLPSAIGERTLLQQLSATDIPQFFRYTTQMFYLRQVAGILPFGPKLKNFVQLVKEQGILGYHVSVYKKAQHYKSIYKELYQANMQVFKMEEIMTDLNQIKSMAEFVNIPCPGDWHKQIRQTFDNERVKEAIKKRDIDQQIEKLLIQNSSLLPQTSY